MRRHHSVAQFTIALQTCSITWEGEDLSAYVATDILSECLYVIGLVGDAGAEGTDQNV